MGSHVKPGAVRDFDCESLEVALEHDGLLPLEGVVEIIERFGAALSAADGVPQDVRALMGTPRYAPPEAGEVAADATSEQFSLAAIAYHLLTGQPPFAAETPREAVPKPLRAHRSEASPALERVVFRGLARARGERYPSLPEFVASFWAAAHLPADVGEPDEATRVSTVSSGIAELLRQDRGRSRLASPAIGDERTVVSTSAAEAEATVLDASGRFERPAAPPTIVGRAGRVASIADTVYPAHTRTLQLPGQRRRRRTTIAVTAGGLALALGAAILWRAAARPTPVAGPPSRPTPAPALNLPPAVTPPAAPTVARPAPEARTPEPLPAEPPARPVVPERSGRPQARARARPVPVVDDAPAADAAKECRISVGSFPWSDVWIDGADTGLQTPIVNLAVSCGRHRLEFKRKDLKVDQKETVVVSRGDGFKRQYELKGLDLDE